MLTVSVVVISYNLELYINEALASVFAQSHLPEEIILADDNSSDSTVSIVNEHYPSVLIRLNPYGQGALLNALNGLLHSSCDLIFFLDGDDVWMPDKLHLCVSEFAAHPRHYLVSHSHHRVDSRLQRLAGADFTSTNIKRVFKKKNDSLQSNLRNSLLWRKGFWLGSAYGIRRSSFPYHDFLKIVMHSPLSKYSYLDLVIGPYLAGINSYGTLGYLPNHYFLYRMHASNSASSSSLAQQRRVLRKMRATTLLTCRCLKATPIDPLVISTSYMPTVRYYMYLDCLLRGSYFAAAKNFFHARSCIRSYPGGYLKEVARVLLVLFPWTRQLFFRFKSDIVRSFLLIRARITLPRY